MAYHCSSRMRWMVRDVRRTNRMGWYNLNVLPELNLEDVVRLRKPHPCGGYEWKVVRMGADIGLECLTCKRRVILPRRELARRLKSILPRGPDEPAKI